MSEFKEQDQRGHLILKSNLAIENIVFNSSNIMLISVQGDLSDLTNNGCYAEILGTVKNNGRFTILGLNGQDISIYNKDASTSKNESGVGLLNIKYAPNLIPKVMDRKEGEVLSLQDNSFYIENDTGKLVTANKQKYLPQTSVISKWDSYRLYELNDIIYINSVIFVSIHDNSKDVDPEYNNINHTPLLYPSYWKSLITMGGETYPKLEITNDPIPRLQVSSGTLEINNIVFLTPPIVKTINLAVPIQKIYKNL
jgi:hypothetical protein